MTEVMLVKIPRWAEGKRIYVTVEWEGYMLREPNGEVWVKIDRCNQCGKCCILDDHELEHGWPVGMKESDGVMYCGKIDTEWKDGKTIYNCVAGPFTPHSCNKDALLKGGSGKTKINVPDCPLMYERIK